MLNSALKKITAILLSVVFMLTLRINTSAISAKSAVLICADTGEIIYSRNAEERLPMASTTKIMTAFLLCEQDLKRQVTVSFSDINTEGTSMGLKDKDTVTLGDLLYGMLLASGNDAANAAAAAVGGTVGNFVNLMNEKAKSLGLKNTHFVTPSGLDADGHYSTAYDMAILAKNALNNADFAKAAATKEKTVSLNNGEKKITLTNHNRLLRSYSDVTGVKTGFTKKSGRCLVSSAEKDGKRVIAVTLNDPDDWKDHRYMLDLGLETVKEYTVSPKQNYADIRVYGGNKNSIRISFPKLSVCSAAKSELGCEVNVKSAVFAPVKKGQKLGEIVFTSDGRVIKKCDLNSDEDIKREKSGFFKKLINISIVILGSI